MLFMLEVLVPRDSLKSLMMFLILLVLIFSELLAFKRLLFVASLLLFMNVEAPSLSGIFAVLLSNFTPERGTLIWLETTSLSSLIAMQSHSLTRFVH